MIFAVVKGRSFGLRSSPVAFHFVGGLTNDIYKFFNDLPWNLCTHISLNYIMQLS